MNETQFQLFLEHTPAAVAMFDRDMRYLVASRRWLEDYRLDGAVLGRSHYEVFPEIPERWKVIHRRALGGEVLKAEEDRFERADGVVQWLRWEVRPWRGADGEIGGIVIFTEDVTKRRSADEQRQLFVSLAENSHEFIGMCDTAFTPFFVNAAGLRMVGLGSLEEARGTAVKEFFFPEDQAFIMKEFFPRVLRLGRGDVEIRFRHFATGEALWMHYSVFSLTDLSGNPSGFATVSRNITEDKKAEQRLIEAQGRLQAVMRAAPVGISYSSDPSCEFITGNPTLLAQFEMRPEENISASASDPAAPGRTLRFFYNGREITNAELPLQRAVAERREIPPMELEVLLPSGRRWFTEASAAPILGKQDEIIGGVAVTVDITERRNTELALRETDRRKDEFLAMLAHELRNPLASLRNALHVLRMPTHAGPETDVLVAIMERQADHLVLLVDDLLDVSRITSGKIKLKKERVDLVSLIKQAIETTEPLLQSAGHKLTISLPVEPLFVDGDPVRLVQVFANLLNNAAKYTDPEGRIDIIAARVGAEAIVTVRDNGVGIPSEMLSSIFDLFVQVDKTRGKSRSGIGVGLALTRNLVQLHGGRVEARSAGIGHGSEFEVRLPLAVTSHLEERIGEVATAATADVARRVLVVDDDRDVADSLVMLLKCLGMDVRVAYGGRAALAAVAEFRPRLAFVDIGMPGMDGYETARRIRMLPEGKDLVLAALSGWGQEDDRRRALEAGFDHHFVKPIKIDAMEKLLASASLGA